MSAQVTSKLASLIADRGKVARAQVRGILLHTTGSSIVAAAKRAGVDPEAFAVDYYLHAAGKYPHYLVAHDGSVYSFCGEMKQAAHAAWDPEERRLYEVGGWHRWWIDTLGDGEIKGAPRESFYEPWWLRWGRERGLAYTSPIGILRQIGGETPNEAYVGVEVLDSKPFTPAQHDALAVLCADVFRRHELLDPRAIEPGTLPQAWLCTHSDISPMRRWQRRRDGSGFPWDPLEGQIDWRLLEQLLRRA